MSVYVCAMYGRPECRLSVLCMDGLYMNVYVCAMYRRPECHLSVCYVWVSCI